MMTFGRDFFYKGFTFPPAMLNYWGVMDEFVAQHVSKSERNPAPPGMLKTL